MITTAKAKLSAPERSPMLALREALREACTQFRICTSNCCSSKMQLTRAQPGPYSSCKDWLIIQMLQCAYRIDSMEGACVGRCEECISAKVRI